MEGSCSHVTTKHFSLPADFSDTALPDHEDPLKLLIIQIQITPLDFYFPQKGLSCLEMQPIQKFN